MKSQSCVFLQLSVRTLELHRQGIQVYSVLHRVCTIYLLLLLKNHTLFSCIPSLPILFLLCAGRLSSRNNSNDFIAFPIAARQSDCPSTAQCHQTELRGNTARKGLCRFFIIMSSLWVFTLCLRGAVLFVASASKR